MHTNELIEHVNLEKTEINNIINKLTQQTVDNTATSNNNEIKNEQLSLQNEDKEEVLDYNIQKLAQESEQDTNYNQGIQHNQEVGSNAEDAENSTNEVTNYVEASLGNNIENNEPTHIYNGYK